MKPLFPFLFLSTPVLAIPAVTTLTLVNDPIPGQPGKHYGVLDVGISGAGITPSTSTTTSNAIYQNNDVAVFLPGIMITDTITAGTTITFTANVTGTGDVKATGTLQAPLNEYLAWTIAQGIPGAPGQGDANQDGLPNALAWAFGLAAGTDASGGLPAVTSGHGFQFEIPGSGSVA